MYTIVTNKDAHGRKGSIVALVLGTDSDTVLHALRQIDSRLRNKVTEITLDLADSMQATAQSYRAYRFSYACHVCSSPRPA
nr:hypothetical protein [Paramuribaculum intestinale]